MLDALKTADLWWFIPATAAMGLVFGLQSLRWHLLLRAIDIRLGYSRTARLYMIGAFFNLFLFGATGGDVVKIFYAAREARSEKAGAFLSIVLDRVIGLLALALVSSVVIAWRFDDYLSTPIARGLLLTVGMILGGSIAVVVVAALVAILKLERRLPEHLPMRRAIVDLAVATQRYARNPGTLATALGLSIAGHISLFSTFYFAARAFTDALSYLDVFSVMPVVGTITSIPISLGGIGLREGIFETLFHSLYGLPGATAVLISISGYLITVLWGLVGGVIYLTYRPAGGHAAIREMSEEAEESAAAVEEAL